MKVFIKDRDGKWIARLDYDPYQFLPSMGFCHKGDIQTLRCRVGTAADWGEWMQEIESQIVALLRIIRRSGYLGEMNVIQKRRFA